MTRQVYVGDVAIGGGAPVSIQSMSNIDTRKVDEVLRQIDEMKGAGCQIMRLAVPNIEAAEAFGKIKKQASLPLVADIHFDYRLAILAMENGADKIRINPGNIGSRENLKKIVKVAKEREIPIRVGVNSGSLEKDILFKNGGITPQGLVESATKSIEFIQELNFDKIVISLKASNPKLNFMSYKLMSEKSDFPLHIGVTESGTVESGKIKSAVGIGALLLLGIGDTMRVSLTGNPVNEIEVAKNILSASGIYVPPIEIISCPTCGRTGVDLNKIATEIEKELLKIGEKRKKIGLKALKVAIMGCEVNGPGEAKDADLGVACGKGKGAVFINGKVINTVKERDIKRTILDMVENYEKYI